MEDTSGLDALAALCGTASAATQTNSCQSNTSGEKNDHQSAQQQQTVAGLPNSECGARSSSVGAVAFPWPSQLMMDAQAQATIPQQLQPNQQLAQAQLIAQQAQMNQAHQAAAWQAYLAASSQSAKLHQFAQVQVAPGSVSAVPVLTAASPGLANFGQNLVTQSQGVANHFNYQQFQAQVQQAMAAQALAAAQQNQNQRTSVAAATTQTQDAQTAILPVVPGPGTSGAVAAPSTLDTKFPSPAVAAMPSPSKITAHAAAPNDTKSPSSSQVPHPIDLATSSVDSEEHNENEQQNKRKHTSHSVISDWEDKKEQKRAANRRSAHLSRKRKKMYLEDLKDENIELRRKEQILRAIPDLIVVFDSSGCISFVSESVSKFLDYSPKDLEESSFWDLLTEDSVRMIKAAFMDALAVKRRPMEDSTPLASGDSISVRIVDRKQNKKEEGDGLLWSLKGIVHFSESSPECVCSIRPCGEAIKKPDTNNSNKKISCVVPLQEQGTTTRAKKFKVAPHQISDIDSEKSVYAVG